MKNWKCILGIHEFETSGHNINKQKHYEELYKSAWGTPVTYYKINLDYFAGDSSFKVRICVNCKLKQYNTLDLVANLKGVHETDSFSWKTPEVERARYLDTCYTHNKLLEAKRKKLDKLTSAERNELGID